MHRRHKPLKPRLPTSSLVSKELNDASFGHELSRRPMCQYHLPFQKYLPWNRKLLILPIWLHMANKPQCIIEMPFKVQMLVIGRKLWTMKLTCSPNMALGNSNHYRKAVDCHWMYTIKASPEGENTRYKARLCAQGYLQIPGIDFNDTYAPTVHLDTLHALFHLAVMCVLWGAK